jgi:hypothetical protein
MSYMSNMHLRRNASGAVGVDEQVDQPRQRPLLHVDYLTDGLDFE